MKRLAICLVLLLAACDGDFFTAPASTSFVLPEAWTKTSYIFLRDEIASGQSYESEYQLFADGRFVFSANLYPGSSSCPYCVGYGYFAQNDSSVTLSFEYFFGRPDVPLVNFATGTWKGDTLRLTYPADLVKLDPLFRDEPYVLISR
jgi:hypothetical protein